MDREDRLSRGSVSQMIEADFLDILVQTSNGYWNKTD